MLRGLYSAAAGMMSQMLQMDATADNLANINTAGFKRAGVQFGSFSPALVREMTKDQNVSVGEYAQGTQVLANVINFDQGQMTNTGNPLDVALNGEGFFEVSMPNGEKAYTRNGQFTMDSEGFITMGTGGYRVQGDGGEIQIPPATKAITIQSNGEVSADNKVLGRLKVVHFEDEQNLKRMGGTLYQTSETPTVATDYTIEQGALEQANANVITELVNSMTGVRVYEMLQKSIHVQNETLGKGIDVGRPR